MSTNYIDQITDTAGTTQDISESDSTRIFRATCSTAASTAAKVATLQTSNKNFSLATGVRVAVTFTYGNSATTPTLRVDGSSTGTAKTIAVASSATAKTTGNGTTYNTWGPYETVLFTYDGTYWVNGGSSRSIYNAYSQASSAGSGTVTSVGITNGGGLSISGSPVTGSGSITVGHSNVLTSAQTTQAVYPIKIDKNGHISAYGSAVTIPTDTKLQVAEVTSNITYYPIVGSGTTAATREYDTTGFSYSATTGTTSTTGMASVRLGNSTASGTAGNKLGALDIYGSGSRYVSLRANVTATSGNNFTINLPAKDGTVALTSDIPDVSGKIDTAGTGLSKSGTTLNHSNSVTAGTAGTSSATSGSTLAVPYVTYDAQGHITATGTHTHTISGFLTSSSTLDATKLSGTIPSSCYTDTDTKVTQNYSASTDASYPLLFSATSGVSSTLSRGATTALLNNNLYFNPVTLKLTAYGLIVSSVDHTITSSEYTTLDNALTALI